MIVMIIVEVQGDDLRRFDKHEKRATLWMGEYPPVMNCTFFAVHKALKYGCKHPLPSYAVHKSSCRIVIPDLV